MVHELTLVKQELRLESTASGGLVQGELIDWRQIANSCSLSP
jgi:hypothetical protein